MTALAVDPGFDCLAALSRNDVINQEKYWHRQK